jgi:hypothetical protein
VLSMKPVLPEGYEVFKCKKSIDKILYYKNHALDDRLKVVFSQFLNEYSNTSN